MFFWGAIVIHISISMVIYKYTVQYNHDGIQKKSPDLYKPVSLGKLNLYK